MQHVQLNVGGCVYDTSRDTLKNSNSFFSGLMTNNEECYFFVDRDPTHFRYVLNWMRGVRHLPEDDATLKELAWETDFFCLVDMHAAITQATTRISVPLAIHNIARTLAS